MILTFIGKGSCFNTELGNNSAYYKVGSSLLLLDCGCDVFSKIKNDVLLDCTDVTILITHMHDDHIGSLGSLLQYCKYVLKITAKVVYPNEVELSDTLYRLGIRPSLYEFKKSGVNVNTGIVTVDTSYIIQSVETVHNMGMNAYGYLVKIGSESFYFSGDSKIIPELAMTALKMNGVSEFYQDISGKTIDPTEYCPHLQYENLLLEVSIDLRSKVFLMHLDEEFVLIQDQAILDGFGVV